MSDLPQFFAKFNEIVEEAQVFCFMARDSELQRQACTKLEEFLVQIAGEKGSAVAANNEDYSNALLGCECATHALIAQIKMWLLLKEERPEKAWDMLVTAQDNIAGAVRAHIGFAHLVEHSNRLTGIEQLVFPPQVFLSSGMIVERQICSICGREYEDCQHIKGRPYMGEFCTVTLVPSRIDHVSIVENPANKRCRIVKFSDEGGWRNRMTWRVEPADETTEQQGEDLSAHAIVATSTTFTE